MAPAVISFGFAGIVSTRVGTTGFPFLLIVAVPFPGATISTPLIFLPVGSILFLTTPSAPSKLTGSFPSLSPPLARRIPVFLSPFISIVP